MLLLIQPCCPMFDFPPAACLLAFGEVEDCAVGVFEPGVWVHTVMPFPDRNERTFGPSWKTLVWFQQPFIDFRVSQHVDCHSRGDEGR